LALASVTQTLNQMKRTVYIVLTTIAILYFIGYPMTVGVWYFASQIWNIPPPAGFNQSKWLNLALVNVLLFGGLARLSPYLVSKETQTTTPFRWMNYVTHMIAFASLSFLLLGLWIIAPKSDYLLFMIPGIFVVFVTLVWGISKPMQILGHLPDKWLAKMIMGEDVFPGDKNRVLETIETPRLRLLALKQRQLYLLLHNPTGLEEMLEVRLSRDILTEPVIRALEMKIEKMSTIHVQEHVWFTYWLVVVSEENVGVGLAGFKGVPAAGGLTEIGYGIVPAYQNQGYMTEAVKALVDWAFNYPYCYCQAIIATEVHNPASRRLLEKLGANLIFESEDYTSWEFVNKRKNYSPRQKNP
jgi:ribosomal-protein-alanine N-acetyltransferase